MRTALLTATFFILNKKLKRVLCIVYMTFKRLLVYIKNSSESVAIEVVSFGAAAF